MRCPTSHPNKENFKIMSAMVGLMASVDKEGMKVFDKLQAHPSQSDTKPELLKKLEDACEVWKLISMI